MMSVEKENGERTFALRNELGKGSVRSGWQNEKGSWFHRWGDAYL